MDAAADDHHDQGHRYGNFPNYYAFHPPQQRLRVLERTRILPHLRNALFNQPENSPRTEACSKSSPPVTPIKYCDLGCNAGHLTRALAAALVAGATPAPHVAVDALGLDLDARLIARAHAAADGAGAPPAEGGAARADFRACDLTSAVEHDGACAAFFAAAAEDERRAADLEQDEQGPPRAPPPPAAFHLTSIFSTTMWIHVHAGDAGLRAFLERACRWTRRFLLIEPQPSGW